MSIARADAIPLKVRRTLMFSTAMRVLHIKDLKDLTVFYRRDTIDMQDLKDLKRCFHRCDRGGQAPALRAEVACSSDRGGQAPALREKNVPSS